MYTCSAKSQQRHIINFFLRVISFGCDFATFLPEYVCSRTNAQGLVLTDAKAIYKLQICAYSGK